MTVVAFQTELRPELPEIIGAKDYREFRATLEDMDRILVKSGIEQRFISRYLEKAGRGANTAKHQSYYRTARMALRYCILLALTNESYRELSRHVADSILFQWFTHTSTLGKIKPISKSSIERFEKMFKREDITELIHDLNLVMSNEDKAKELLYRDTALKFDAIFADTTCIKANIHFPVDWVLLRDGVRTLINAISVIRKHGLKHRISTPQQFKSNMNKLCMEMTQVRKKAGAKKSRKKTLRKMKKLVKVVEKHAKAYYQELQSHWQDTDLSKLEAQVILDRIKNILDQLPKAIEQAHERIIGERRVANKDKILSIYDPDVRVIVRGKAGAEVEFGNALYLAEQADGLLVDWKVIKEQPPADSSLCQPSIERITGTYGDITSYTGDRGFDSKSNRDYLENRGISNAICPRSVQLMQEKLEDKEFCSYQKRRAGTEARIGILKNVYIGSPFRSKGFTNRQMRIEWAVLTHNLWKLASMAAQKRLEAEDEARIAA